MKKLTLITLILVACFSVKAQKIKEYKASNGITYHIGDTVVMAKGSLTDGRFGSLGMTGMAAIAAFDKKTNGDNLWASRSFAGGRGVITKINKQTFAGNIKYGFTLDFKQGAKYELFIEDAIRDNEIKQN